MKELNRFRQFINEGPEDIDIMGQKFNFNDICPGAHKAIANLAKEYANNDVMLGDLLYLANLHQTFFNLEKKALGPQGIDADDLNNIKELYVDINNIANNAFGEEVGKEVKTYMDMHMGKIKKAGLKASEPGGSSDRNFGENLNEAEQPYVVPGEEGGFKFNEDALEDYFSKTSFIDPNMGEEFFFAGPKAEKDPDGNDLFLSLMGDPGFSEDINGILDGFAMGERYSKEEIEAALDQATDFYLGVY